jgi:putative oxidoreductase
MALQDTSRSLPPSLDFALLVLRFALAIVFLYHGSGILFGVLGGPGPAGFAAYKHWPLLIGYLVGLAQVAGGIAVLLGVFQRIGTVCLMIVMIGAIFTVHLAHGFSVANGGYEFALTEFLIALALFFTGPGAYSLASVLPPGLRKL